MLVRNLQKVGDYKKSILAQDENLRLAIQNDQNVSDAIKKARAGIRPDLTVKQNRIPEQVLTDVIEIKEKAMNNLRSIFSEEQAKKFLNGDGRTKALTQDDLEYLNIFWEDLKPVLQSKTGLTLKFFRDILKKSTAGRRANYGFYTGRTTPAKSSVINTTEELLKTVPPIDMLRAANKKAASIGQTIPEGASLSKDLSKLIGNFPTGGDKRLLKLEQLSSQDKMDFYKRFQTIFEGYDPDVEKWKKANMKDDMDFVNDIRNLIPDMTNFERDFKQLDADLMAAREAITLAPVPVPVAPSVPTVPSVAEAKDELQEPLPDIKPEIIQQEAKETLPTLPDEPKAAIVEPQYKKEDDEPYDIMSAIEGMLDPETALVLQQSRNDLLSQQEELVVADDILRVKEATLIQKMVRGKKAKADKEARLQKIQEARTFIHDRVFDARQARAMTRDDQQIKRDETQSQLSRMGVNRNQTLPPLILFEPEPEPQVFTPPVVLERDTSLDVFNTTQTDVAKGRAFMKIDEREKKNLERIAAEYAAKEASIRERETESMAKEEQTQRLIELNQLLKAQATTKKEQARLRRESKDLEAQLEAERKERESQELQLKAAETDRKLKEAAAERKAKKERAKKRKEIEDRVIPLEEAPVEAETKKLPPKLSRSVAFTPQRGTLKEEQTRLMNRLQELGRLPSNFYLKTPKQQSIDDIKSNAIYSVQAELDKVNEALDTIDKEEERIREVEKEQQQRDRNLMFFEEMMAMPTTTLEEKENKANRLGSWLGSSREKYFQPEVIQSVRDEKDALRDFLSTKREDDYQAKQFLLKKNISVKDQRILDRFDDAWKELGRSPTDVDFVGFKNSLRKKYLFSSEWLDPIQEFLQDEADRQWEQRNFERLQQDRFQYKSEKDKADLLQFELQMRARKMADDAITAQMLELEALRDESDQQDADAFDRMKAANPDFEDFANALRRSVSRSRSSIGSPRSFGSTMTPGSEPSSLGSEPKRVVVSPYKPRPRRPDRQQKLLAIMETPSAQVLSAEKKKLSEDELRSQERTLIAEKKGMMESPFRNDVDDQRIEVELAVIQDVLVKRLFRAPAPPKRPETPTVGKKPRTSAPPRARPLEDLLAPIARSDQEPFREMAPSPSPRSQSAPSRRPSPSVRKPSPRDPSERASSRRKARSEGLLEEELAQLSPTERAARERASLDAIQRMSESASKRRPSQPVVEAEDPYGFEFTVPKFKMPPERKKSQNLGQVARGRLSDIQSEMRSSSVDTPRDTLQRESPRPRFNPIPSFKRLPAPKTPSPPKTLEQVLDIQPTEQIRESILERKREEASRQIAEARAKRLSEGRGLKAKPRTFIEFGKFKLNENMLEEGTLQVKTLNGSPVPAFSKKVAISDTLQSILMDLIETKKLRGVSDLDDEERRMLETLIIKAGLAHGLGVKKVHQSDEDAKKVKRFDLVRGIYDAGNNSMEVIHELRSLILYFIKTKRLDRKAGIEALQELQ